MLASGTFKNLTRRVDGLSVASPAILQALVLAVLVAACRSGDTGDFSSRFASIHTFDTADYHSLAFSPDEDGVVLFGHHNGLQISRDDGQTWQPVVDQANWDAMNLAYDPSAASRIYMAGHNVYYISDDGGQTWGEVESNLPGLDLHTFGASPVEAGRLYAIPAGLGLYRSDDGGEKWSLVSEDMPRGSNSIIELPDGALLLGATDQGILRSEDSGKTWVQSRAGIDYGAIYAIRGDPKGDRLYAGSDHGVYTSSDGGQNWTATALDDTWIVAIGVNPKDPAELLAVNRGGELYRSSDGGATWE
jgi:photosystem II stability/assembly factor-like uncharacterized protein